MRRGSRGETLAPSKARPLDPANPRLQLLRRFAGLLAGEDAMQGGPALKDFARSRLRNLTALALGESRDAAALADMTRLRAKRARQIIDEIRKRFTDPTLSPAELGRALGLSARYVNGLLQETGSAFAERVLELRLQKALAMLRERRHDRMKIGDIALACGFGDISYFNRCFRRRFGASPTQYRGG